MYARKAVFRTFGLEYQRSLGRGVTVSIFTEAGLKYRESLEDKQFLLENVRKGASLTRFLFVSIFQAALYDDGPDRSRK